jgi:hypothetical protein
LPIAPSPFILCPVAIFDDHSQLARQIEEALEAMDSPRRNALRNLLILAGSLVLFVMFQLVNSSVSGLLILVAVLAIHELGHLAAMKMSGYRDLQMFFIPLFGAAASGSETHPTGTRRAIVSLAGPVPGIAIGVVCAVLFQTTGSAFFMQSARAFLLVNTFNLLPVIPLLEGHLPEKQRSPEGFARAFRNVRFEPPSATGDDRTAAPLRAVPRRWHHRHDRGGIVVPRRRMMDLA